MANECEITVVENTNSDNGYDFWAGLIPGSIDVDSVADMVTKVLAKLDSKDCCLKSLTIYGHGSPGDISVGNGQSGTDTNKEINNNELTVWGPEFNKLKARFCPNGSVTLRGCNVGADQAGANKLFAIAQRLGVNVRAFTGELHEPDWFDTGEWVEATPTQKPEAKAPPAAKKKKKKLHTGGRIPSCLMYRDRERFRIIRLDDIRTITLLPRAWLKKSPAAAAVTLPKKATEMIQRELDLYEPFSALTAGFAIDAYVDFEVDGLTAQETGVIPPSYLCGGFRYLVAGGDWSFLYPLGEAIAQTLRSVRQKR